MYSYAWIITLVIGLILLTIALIVIEFRMRNNETISTWIWILLFASIVIIIIGFGLYLFGINPPKYEVIKVEQNWQYPKQTINNPQQYVSQSSDIIY